MLKTMFQEINTKLKTTDINNINISYNIGIDYIINKLTGIHSFTIES